VLISVLNVEVERRVVVVGVRKILTNKERLSLRFYFIRRNDNEIKIERVRWDRSSVEFVCLCEGRLKEAGGVGLLKGTRKDQTKKKTKNGKSMEERGKRKRDEIRDEEKDEEKKRGEEQHVR
jgi:hypothetical protein